MLENSNGLFHVSEQPGIKVFEPRPSPSFFKEISGDVVFAISGKLLHNYLLPRNCPRVCYYASAETSEGDRYNFIGFSTADFIICVELGWYEKIKNSTLYCYDLPTEPFLLLDECAGYYISYNPVIPLSEFLVTDIMAELLSRNVEIRFTPSLTELAEAISKSTLNFSNIRMRNARI